MDSHAGEELPPDAESEMEKLDVVVDDPLKNVKAWKELRDLDSLPLMKSGYSLEADMKFGWKP